MPSLEQHGRVLYGIDSTGIKRPILVNASGEVIIDETALDARYVEIAGDTMTGPLVIDGTTDANQLRVQGNATQTSDLVVFEQSDGTDVFTVSNTGTTTIGTGAAGDSTITWRISGSTVYIEGVDDDDSDKYKIAGAAGFGNDDLFEIDTAGAAVHYGTLDVQGTATRAFKIFGATIASEVADMYVGTLGQLVITTDQSTDTSPWIEIRPLDDEYGVIFRASNATQTSWANAYMFEGATDYLNIVLNATNATLGLVVDENERVGIGVLPSQTFDVGGNFTVTAAGVVAADGSITQGTGSDTVVIGAATRRITYGSGGDATLHVGGSNFNISNTFGSGTRNFQITDFTRIIPNADNTIDIGDTGSRFEDLHLAGNLTDDTKSVAITNLLAKNVAETVTGAWIFDTGGVTMSADMTMSDAINIVLNATTGTKIGTATSQKLAFFNATPIIQQTTVSQTPATFVANTSGIVDDTATWNGYTIGDIVAILQAFGLIA